MTMHSKASVRPALVDTIDKRSSLFAATIVLFSHVVADTILELQQSKNSVKVRRFRNFVEYSEDVGNGVMSSAVGTTWNGIQIW